MRSLLGLLFVIAACSGGADSTKPTIPPVTSGGPSLKLVEQRPVDDTIFAPSAVVAVQFLDETGAAKAGAPIRFLLDRDSTQAMEMAVGAFRQDSADILTDASGHAKVFVTHLQKAGTGRLRIAALGTNLRDTVQITTRPGRAARIVVSPYDTALFVNATISLSARSLDRANNVRADVISWNSASAGVNVDASGRAHGTAYARATIRVSADGRTDSSYLSVVPPGTIVAVWQPIAVGTPHHFKMFNTDGSNVSEIPIAVAAACSAIGVSWRSTGDSFLFAGGSCYDLRIFRSLVQGAQALVTPSVVGAKEMWPSYSRDGQFIYFTSTPADQNGEIWRMRSDGSAAQRIGPAARDFYDLDQYPSASPDGSTILFSSNRTYRRTDRTTIQLLNIANGSVRESGLEGDAPAWSPQGDRIAFHVGDEYAVANADGTAMRILSKSHYTTMAGPPGWSPDGRWIVTVGVDPKGYAPFYGRLEIIEVQTGLVLPLAWTSQMAFPAWRP